MTQLPIVGAVSRWSGPFRRALYSRWFGAAFATCLFLGTVLWFLTRERLPRTVVIASGARNGQYYLCGETLASSIGARIERELSVLVTEGSVENRQRLIRGEAQLAIIQNGAVSMTGLSVIAPLFQDVVHVVVRKGQQIDSIRDLLGKNVALGPAGSGMRASALEILAHYGVQEDALGAKTGAYFRELETDPELDAAIVTTGYVNQDLKQLLASAEFELRSIVDGEAISILNPYFALTTIPRGLYHEGPSVPAAPVDTLATMAVLVAREDVSTQLVEQVVAALYEDYPRWEVGESGRHMARLLSAGEASQWQQLPLHAVTQTYFEPYKGLILLKDFMESLVATKDLLFTLGAGFYVLWLWRHKWLQRRSAAALAIQRERLNKLLDATIRIEAQQMETDDPAELRRFLDEVTRIKLHALDELTDEDLRGDQMFAIFLTQCSNLSRKLQLKISLPGK